MAPRERFIKTLTFSEPDRIFYHFGTMRPLPLQVWYRQGLPPTIRYPVSQTQVDEPDDGVVTQIGRAVLDYDRVVCIRPSQWQFRGSFRTDPVIMGRKVPEFVRINTSPDPDSMRYRFGPLEEAFAITANEEDGNLIAPLEAIPEGGGSLPSLP